MKALVLAHGEGEYDCYCESVDYVFMVPNKVTYSALYKEYTKWGETNLVEKRSPKTGRVLSRTFRLSFANWLKEEKRYKTLTFEYVCP